MIHQPSGGAQGQASDIAIQAKEILKWRERLNSIYSKHTGKATEFIEPLMERDHFMSPEEANEFGLIDKIIHHEYSLSPLPSLSNLKYTSAEITSTSTSPSPNS